MKLRFLFIDTMSKKRNGSKETLNEDSITPVAVFLWSANIIVEIRLYFDYAGLNPQIIFTSISERKAIVSPRSWARANAARMRSMPR